MRYRSDWLGVLALATPLLTAVYFASAAPRRPRATPQLGAFSAPVKFNVTYNGVTYEFSSPAITFTPVGSEKVRALSGTGTFLPVGTPIPPIPTPLTVTGYSSSSIVSGATFQILGTGFSGSPTVTWNGQGAAVSAVTATSLTATAPSVTTAATAPVIVIQAGQSAQGPGLTVTPTVGPPPPVNVVNVKENGVKGDGTTVDVAALNSLIRTAPAGATLYFPASTYILNDALKIFRSDLSFLGDGDASILKSTAGSYHIQIGSGQAYTGITFRKLQLLGTPGQYMADGTSRGGVLNFGSKGTVFEDCLFTGCAEPILDAGQPMTTANTVINRCRFNGWGRMAIFCNGGEQVTNCTLTQDDPNLYGERSSHGFYIHGGASGVTVADTSISGARKYAIQQYSEAPGTTTTGVKLLRLTIRDCANGIIYAHSQVGAGEIVDSVIDGCTISGTYAGSSIAIKDGTGVKITNNVIDGNSGAAAGHSGAGVYCGVWAPYEPGFSLKDILVTGNTVKGCDRGAWTLPSNGGSFTNVQITGNNVSANRVNYDITGPGVIYTPTRTPSAGSRTTIRDTRPSDDSSRAHQ